MKLRNTLFILPLCLLAIPAIAQDAAVDVNGDGNYSFPEIQVAMPDMSMDDFTLMDANGDGLLDADEIAIGIESGLLTPMSE